ncbi:uncharacterized protein LOC127838398 isoform X1 [Dreissena polymorpha]|uniref:uncharacterized protein LOC127838398 isoform X1 n=1 Tax=Dreissena polymorpha TaxID=45954 RepID=UPI0022643C1D|nr:uncharacterized protein LOC127838398 isoform X1 [Dreissena polymorpha]XP_052222080.1 uncharacterized protein LOC127838398 isoform X1 [Dreissena polymorpha]XP_052222081.1 uncharacterized protein LOC127838398 isoform X1 [Dreissena polymorpha]
MMQDDQHRSSHDTDTTTSNFYLSNDEDTILAQSIPLVEQNSKSSYATQVTGISKRSTTEEELRSLSTTPRYSHEDLGRIVSPPHSSDEESLTPEQFEEEYEEVDDTPSDIFDPNEHFRTDTLSAKQVLLKSRSSVYSSKYPGTILSAKLSDSGTNPVLLEKIANVGTGPVNIITPRVGNFEKVQQKEAIVHDKINHSTHARGTSSEKGSSLILHPRDKGASFTSHPRGTTFSEKGSSKPVNQNGPAKPLLPLIKQKRKESYQSNQSDKDSLKSIKSHLSSQTNRHRFRAAELMSMRMSIVDDNLRDIILHAEKVSRDLSNEHDHRTMLENQLRQIDEERKDLNQKLATLRVKLGVANSNYNVSKTECEQMRKKFQETEIQKARLEERIQTCTKELGKLRDPDNPDSNVNLKKIVLNDRKEIRRLRTELEGVRSERSEVQKQIQDRDEKIKMLKIYIGEAKDQLAEVQKDSETAKISVVGERKKREEVEEKHNELLKEKAAFDTKMTEIRLQMDEAALGSTGIQQLVEEFKDKEQVLNNKLATAERKLKDVLTQIEQEKNRNMPQRTASSIKYHQYRMLRTGMVSETTPHVVVVTNPNSSVAASGKKFKSYLGKTVVSTKPVTSLPGSKKGSLATPRVKGGSLPAKR